MGGTDMKTKIALALLAALCLAALAAPAAAGARQLSVQPASMSIGTFYAGTPVTFSGEVADNEDVALEIVGPSEDVTFDLKGRVGPFWLNRGLVHVENAPILYVLLLPNPSLGDKELTDLELGLGHLKESIRISSPGHDTDQLLASFFAFKQAKGLYQQKAGAVTYASSGPGRKRFEARFDFPSSLVAGQYQLRTIILRSGSAVERLSDTYLVRDEAFIKYLKDLALNDALLFGVLSVVIALMAGGMMGVVFKGGKGGH